MNDEEEQDFQVDDIISQLKNKNNSLKKAEKQYPDLTPDEIDDFIIKHASKMIVDASDALSEQMELIENGNVSSKEIEAASALLNSFNSTVEILQKRKIADNKNKTQKEITELQINSRKEGEEDKKPNNLTMTRDELVKILMPPKEENS